jgi:hypothetical protein
MRFDEVLLFLHLLKIPFGPEGLAGMADITRPPVPIALNFLQWGWGHCL